MYGYKSFLFTQVGFKFKEDFDVNKSINVLLSYTKFSVENQTNKDFTWVFLIGDLFTEEHKKRILNNISGVDIMFIKLKEGGINMCSEIDKYTVEKEISRIFNLNEYISFRLDSDDYMHPELLDTVAKNLVSKYNGDNIVICNSALGYQYYPEHSPFSGYYSLEVPNIAIGMGIISKYDNTHDIIHKKHNALKSQMKETYPNVDIVKITLSDIPMYIYNRTDQSYSYEAWEKQKKTYIKQSKLSQDDVNLMENEFRIKKEMLS